MTSDQPGTNDGELNPAIMKARFWRNQCQLLDQKNEFEKETQQMMANLEAVNNERAETKRRTHDYQSFIDEFAQLQVALDIINIQVRFWFCAISNRFSVLHFLETGIGSIAGQECWIENEIGAFHDGTATISGLRHGRGCETGVHAEDGRRNG